MANAGPPGTLTRPARLQYASFVPRALTGRLALLALVASTPAFADGGIPVSRLTGGGPRAADCLAALEVVGVELPSRARTVSCADGDAACDHDRLVNGRCELWVRACVNHSDARCDVHGVSALTIEDAAGDRDRTILARTLERLAFPAAEPACAALTTLTVPLGTRANGSPRKGRKVVGLTARGTSDATDDDRVTFVCTPPEREKRRAAVSFPAIQRRIFAKQCAFSGCHGPVNPQAGLVLTGPDAYDALVDRPVSAEAGRFAGKKRVVPGAPTTSFLMDKLTGRLAPGDGDPMPLGRAPLSPASIESIRKWILGGAPRERAVGGNLAGEPDEQPRIPPPPPPPDGFQAHLAPFFLADHTETEGCQLVRLGNPDAMWVRQWELFMHEGSHHFILRAFRCEQDTDGNGTSDCDEPGFDAQFPTGFAPCEQFGHLGSAFVVGSQTPHFIVDYQTPATGVAFRLHRNQPLLLNAHYTNPYRDTLAEVWVNATPADPAQVTRPARILFETLANAFIKVPPGTQQTVTADTCAFSASALCQAGGEPAPQAPYFALLGVTSHRHKRTPKFVTDLYGGDGKPVSRGAADMTDAEDGSRHLYVSTEYSDPVNLGFWPPIVVRAGQRLQYTCHPDNGVETPVRLGCEETPGVPPGRSILDQLVDGRPLFGGAARWCRADADCAGFGTGRCTPANLVFGELADDEMCILPGLFYRCDDPASCTS
jgi:hypothetical protein